MKMVDHISNLDGDHLERTIKNYERDGWQIVKVEWEELGDGILTKRWRAFFRKPEKDDVRE